MIFFLHALRRKKKVGRFTAIQLLRDLIQFLEMGTEQGKCARFISHKAWDHLTLAAKEKTDFRKVDPRERFKANFDPFRYSFDNHQPPFTHPEIDVLNIDHAKSSIKL